MFRTAFLLVFFTIPSAPTWAQTTSSAREQEQLNWMLCSQGDFDKKISGCTAIIQAGKDPALSLAFYSRGEAYRRKGESDRAIQDLDQAIKLDPTDKGGLAHSSRALAYFGKGQYDRAIRDYDQVIASNPKDATAFYGRGAAYDRQGKGDRALQDYEHSLALSPTMMPALLNRGSAYLTLNRRDAAMADFDAAIRQCDVLIRANPQVALPLFLRGLAKRRKGDIANGDADITAAKAIYPRVSEAAENVGVKF
jgi:tetratricopeptide (TPR) repeat protein